ncbi:DUF2087 domain-containing protein [Streptomyces sp. NPDC020875]|uniref:DUF2087 domain-containing protein n=1 Tax=Streptomyces sp. NPDC020875 TaxID=3154898 RepID=UPI0033F592B5
MDDTRNRRGVETLFSGGRLIAVPRKADRRTQLLEHLATTLFAAGEEYTEKEVNARLGQVHDDHAALRRYLVIGGQLTRTRDGAAYRRAA